MVAGPRRGYRCSSAILPERQQHRCARSRARSRRYGEKVGTTFVQAVPGAGAARSAGRHLLPDGAFTFRREDEQVMSSHATPARQGLYDPRNEHDSCGVGFVADIHNRPRNQIVRWGLELLVNLDHRGAVGADPLAGDGAGILIQVPDAFLREECAALGIELPAAGGD